MQTGGTPGAGGNAVARRRRPRRPPRTSVTGYAYAYGGDGRLQSYNTNLYGHGGDASATVSVTVPSGAAGYATAGATGGAGDAQAGVATANASVQGASSGYAQATSSTSMTGASVGSYAYAPVGGPASAMTIAKIGSGTPTLIPIAAGEAISNATLTPGASTIGVGGMSIGYGGGGESLQYDTQAYFTFTTSSPETLWLTLVSNMSSNDGTGFDSLVFDINSSVGNYAYTFTTLASAETFFTSNPLDLGNALAGSQYVYLYEYLTLSDPPEFPGFFV